MIPTFCSKCKYFLKTIKVKTKRSKLTWSHKKKNSPNENAIIFEYYPNDISFSNDCYCTLKVKAISSN